MGVDSHRAKDRITSYSSSDGNSNSNSKSNDGNGKSGSLNNVDQTRNDRRRRKEEEEKKKKKVEGGSRVPRLREDTLPYLIPISRHACPSCPLAKWISFLASSFPSRLLPVPATPNIAPLSLRCTLPFKLSLSFSFRCCLSPVPLDLFFRRRVAEPFLDRLNTATST